MGSAREVLILGSLVHPPVASRAQDPAGCLTDEALGFIVDLRTDLVAHGLTYISDA